MLGIDEAGRGPVLGPMVYGVCFCPISQYQALKKLGCADSKALTAEQRAALFELIKSCEFLGWHVDILNASVLSEGMLRR